MTSPPRHPSLTDGIVTLRNISGVDIPALYDWRNDEHNRPMFRDDRPLDFDAHTRFVHRYLSEANGDYWWIVEASHVPVGTISLHGFDTERRACEFGRFIIGRDHRAAGYGRRALTLVIAFARSIGIERIRCEVLRSNLSALRLYESLGFSAKENVHAGPREFVLMEADIDTHAR